MREEEKVWLISQADIPLKAQGEEGRSTGSDTGGVTAGLLTKYTKKGRRRDAP